MKHQLFSIPHPRSITSRRRGPGLRSLSVLEVGLVTIMVGIALAVAIPGYMHLRQESSEDSARARLVEATRILDRRRSTAGTYRGALLPAGVGVGNVTASAYCVETSADGRSWHASGPYGAKPELGACPP